MNRFTCILLALGLSSTALAVEPEVAPNRVYGQWRSGVIGGGGYLQQVHFCPTDASRLYMTSDVGGVFRSDDLGKTWRMIHGTLPAGGGAYEPRGLLVSETDADHVIIACGSLWGANKGIFITRDGGATWKKTLDAMFQGNGSTRNHGRILVASPANANLLLAAADEGVFRSEDFGETWSEVPGLEKLFSPSAIVFDRTEPERVWLCLAGWGRERTTGLFMSQDAGRSFQKIADRAPSEFVQDPANPGVLYGLRDQRPVRSHDLGRTWDAFDQDLPPKKGARDDGEYAAITTGPDFVLLAGHGGNFYRLVAETWQKIDRKGVDESDTWWGRMRPGIYNHFGSALGYVAINPRDADHWFFTDWYAAYESRDAGANWTLRIDGVEMTVIHTVVADPNTPGLVHVGMADLGYFRSTDAGVNFSWNNNGITNNIKSIAPCAGKPGRMYAVGPQRWEWHANQAFITDNFGESWRALSMSGLPDMKDARCNTIVVHPQNPDEAYITISGKVQPGGGGVYRLDGERWEWMGTGLPSEDHLFRKDIWVHGPELAIAADGALMAMSADRGLLFRWDPREMHWSPVTRPAGGGGPNAIIADPLTPSRFYLAMKEGGLHRTDDTGESWQRLSDHNIHWVAVDPKSPTTLAVTTNRGVVASNDGGSNWVELDSALPFRHPRNVVAVADGRVYVGTGGNGVFWTELPQTAQRE